MKSASLKKDNAILRALRCVIIGSVLGGMLCAALLIVFSFGFVRMQHIPQFAIEPIVICISVVGSFFSGYTAVRLSKKSGLVFGSLSGLLLFVLLFLAGVILARESVTLTTLTRLAVMVISGAIGGFMSVSRKTKIK